MVKEIAYGYCHCGCGEKTKPSDRSNKNIGRIKGVPINFIHGHNARIRKLKDVRHSEGYVLRLIHGHPYSDSKGYVSRSRLVAEKALGKHISTKHDIHHVNEIRDDDSSKNLVVCENRSYHKILHRRQKALDACGNAGWRKCSVCKIYDDPENLYTENGRCYHNKCVNEYNQKQKLKRLKKEGNNYVKKHYAVTA